ncbi:hypothetical protein LCGC14_2044450 [marine sediment metagenome]|uniref:Uncharacterized protein n=1 Tax=marine sediment metagenome TaxID=412755 RepID=A0A0F9ER12_9ZZZZ
MSKPRLIMTPQAQRARIEKLLKDIFRLLALILGALTFGIGASLGLK